jgi:hypothetical protein
MPLKSIGRNPRPNGFVRMEGSAAKIDKTKRACDHEDCKPAETTPHRTWFEESGNTRHSRVHV